MSAKKPVKSNTAQVESKSIAAELTSFWPLGRQSLTEFWQDKHLYLAIVGLVIIPANILSTYFGANGDAGLQTYIGVAGLFMDVALLYAVVRKHREGDGFGLRTAYYSGSHIVLRFLVVTLLLGLMILPLGIATEIYTAGSSGVALAGGEMVLLGLVGLPFVLLSWWLLIRAGLAWVVVADREVRPVMAIRLSWRMTRRRFWPVAGRVAGLVLWLIILLVLPMVVLAGLYEVTGNLFFSMLLQIMVSLIGVPFITLYGFNLYDNVMRAAGE